ncbi:MAG: hypothetical protein LBV41_13290 [Cytophagaceae bacterium]|jgi:hypothetical protein|nr:hypothetical protein [Cytophagaceae bacterium]
MIREIKFLLIAMFCTIACTAQNVQKMNYSEQWKKIDELINTKNLPKSAMTEVMKVYDFSTKEKNYPQAVKAVIYRFNLMQQTEENSAQAIVALLKREAEALPQPARSVIYTLTGDFYKSYWQQNRWQIEQRTQGAASDDVETWDVARLFAEAVKYYTLAVQDEKALQSTPLEQYEALILYYDKKDKAAPALLPTLYDMLTYHTIKALESELNVALPQQAFVLNRAEYLSDIRAFAEYNIVSPDTLSAEYRVITLYQKLLKFRLQQLAVSSSDENKYALVNIDVQRLKYVRSKGVYSNGDALYQKALLALMNSHRNTNAWNYPAYALAYHYNEQGEKWGAERSGEYRAKRLEAFDLCKQIAANGGDENITKLAAALQKQITAPAAELTLERQQLPDAPMLAFVEYRNTSNIFLHVYKLSDDEAVKHDDGYSLYEFNFNAHNAIRKQQIALPEQNDYQSYSAEIKIDALPQGNYALFVTTNADNITTKIRDDNTKLLAATVVKTSSLMAVIRNSHTAEKGWQVFVADSKTGKPLPNAVIAYYMQIYRQGKRTETHQGDYTTGADGMTYIPYKSEGGFKYAIITHNNQQLLLTGWNTNYWHSDNKKEYERVLFFTDRAIYRPGQTVYYKALRLRTNGDGHNTLVAKTKMDIELKDVNYQTIATQTHTTNEYGTVQGSFIIPQGLLNGTMTITTQYGNVNIEVEEYKRPTFEVSFNPVDKNYGLNDSVTVSGIAKALAGYAVDGSKVQYRVVRNTQYRLLRHWWYPPMREPQREIASGETSTDVHGAFNIAFKAEADDAKDDLIYNYTVTADVTDINGETRSASLTVKISKKPLMVVAAIPEVVNARRLEFDIATTNLNGDFTPASVSVTVTALQQPARILRERLWNEPDTFVLQRDEFVRLFPVDAYGNETNPEHFALGKQIAAYTLKTDNTKNSRIALDAMANAEQGMYRIHIKARNESGVEVEDIRFVRLVNDAMPAAPIRNMGEWLTADKTFAEAGENVQFMVAGGNADTYIYYETVHKNAIVETATIRTGTTPQQIVIPVKETYRGGFAVQFVMVQNNRVYKQMVEINVPYANKMLDVKFTTFRNQLLPGEREKWTLSVSNKAGEKEMAEMIATLYDASLDAFAPHIFPDISNFYPQRSHIALQWSTPEQQRFAKTSYVNYELPWAGVFMPVHPVLIPHEYYSYGNVGIRGLKDMRMMKSMASGAVQRESMEMAEDGLALYNVVEEELIPITRQDDMITNESLPIRDSGNYEEATPLAEIATRQNFNETAFFYPQLRTDENGEIIIDFTIPEALTRWKMLGFAHTSEFKVGTVSNELITQKQVAISANAPRFFRENDTIWFTAKVNNITGSDLETSVSLQLFDAMTMDVLTAKMCKAGPAMTFTVSAKQSKVFNFKLAIPEGVGAITYKVTAQAGVHTDGEQRTIPVLTNRMLVTETMPFSIRASEQKKLTFERMNSNRSNTLRHHRLTLEFTSNPAWYAIQAMPYMMEYPYECSEQVFTRFYANSLSAAAVNSSPRVKQVFELWRNIPANKEALLSNLEKNQELKQVMLEETPWIMQADNESERKKRIGLLFDLNRMASEQRRAIEQLKKAQLDNGAFPWFAELPASRYITQHIVSGMGHLHKLNALSGDFGAEADGITRKAIAYLDGCIKDDYDALRKIKDVDLGKQHIGVVQMHYLYACSFDKHEPSNVQQREAHAYYLKQAAVYWMQMDFYSQAMAALVLHRYGNAETAADVIRSLKERALQSDEMGMYFNENRAGYFWYQAPVETQALLIEVFDEVAADMRSVEEMKIWLLRNKQTADWRTTKATAEACFALLMTGSNLLDESALLEVSIGGKPLAKAATEKIAAEAGTGYVKTSWNGSDIRKNMSELVVKNPNRAGIAWGALYWQYFEQLDRITSAETSLRMGKQLFIKRNTERGPVLVPLSGNGDMLSVGDLVTVRMELRADRDYEYVHLKDMRASAFEPVTTLSGYHCQDGLWYYQSVKDAAVNFFIPLLRKGVYVFEYELRVTHRGEFSNGITTFQCMYAPEYSAHSEGVRVRVAD